MKSVLQNVVQENKTFYGLSFLLNCSPSAYLCRYSPVAQQPFHNKYLNSLSPKCQPFLTCPHLPYIDLLVMNLVLANHITTTRDQVSIINASARSVQWSCCKLHPRQNILLSLPLLFLLRRRKLYNKLIQTS